MDTAFLREAIRLSLDKMREGEGGPFGAVVVRDGEIVGRGWNRVTSANDPTAHAEITAIRDACSQLDTYTLAGCDLYSSCEPCPMCLAAIYWARLDHLYFAATREDAAAAGFDDAHIYSQLPLPVSERQLPTRQSLRGEALEALAEWREMEDRIQY